MGRHPDAEGEEGVTDPAGIELLAKLLVYNISVVIHEIYEHRVDPGVPGLRQPGAPPENASAEAPVTKFERLPGNS